MDTGRYNVLLVDDDPVQTDLARRAVVEFFPDFDLTMVAGGDAVLDSLGSLARHNDPMPDIILMDLKLPKLDGLAVLRKLRGHPATRDIPIVVCSAVYTQAEVLMSYKAGANSFVAKPEDLVQCVELFREHLNYWRQLGHPKPLGAIDGATEHTI